MGSPLLTNERDAAAATRFYPRADIADADAAGSTEHSLSVLCIVHRRTHPPGSRPIREQNRISPPTLQKHLHTS